MLIIFKQLLTLYLYEKTKVSIMDEQKAILCFYMVLCRSNEYFFNWQVDRFNSFIIFLTHYFTSNLLEPLKNKSPTFVELLFLWSRRDCLRPTCPAPNQQRNCSNPLTRFSSLSKNKSPTFVQLLFLWSRRV